MCAILSDATLIEQLKKEGSRRKLTTREACTEVFGNGKVSRLFGFISYMFPGIYITKPRC